MFEHYSNTSFKKQNKTKQYVLEITGSQHSYLSVAHS